MLSLLVPGAHLENHMVTLIVTAERMEAQRGVVTHTVHTAERRRVMKPAIKTRSLGFLASFCSLIGREESP